MLPENGTWSALPYHEGSKGDGHYTQKIFWWNEGYDWQTEPKPVFILTARRLDAPADAIKTTDATNANTPEFGSAILTGVEIPSPGCWEFTGSYRSQDLRFVVWVMP